MESERRIFVTGATGFVGREICLKLLRENYYVTALTRRGSILPYPLNSDERITTHQGDVTQPETLDNALNNHDAVIHLVGIIRESPSVGITFTNSHLRATENMVHIAQRCKVRRFLHMSALGTTSKASNPYHSTKWMAEEAVRNSGLDFTIFRPSIIFGPRDDFTNMIARMIRKFHVFPLIGGGHSRLQPISVDDVAEGFVKSIEAKHSIRKTYEIGGPQHIQFRKMVHAIARVLRTSVFTPSVPVSLVKPIVIKLEYNPKFPLTSTQLEMLLEENITEDKMFFDDFQIAPAGFIEGITKYLSK